jgi:hypothetical protein
VVEALEGHSLTSQQEITATHIQPSLLMSSMADCVVAQIDPCRLPGVATTERFCLGFEPVQNFEN